MLSYMGIPSFSFFLQEPDTEICASMLDSLNECLQVGFHMQLHNFKCCFCALFIFQYFHSASDKITLSNIHFLEFCFNSWLLLYLPFNMCKLKKKSLVICCFVIDFAIVFLPLFLLHKL